MPSDKITVGLKLSSFLGKGPRYLCAYARWRARRAASSFWERRPRWPAQDLREAHPVLLCDWQRRAEIKSLVPEPLREKTIAVADNVLQRRFSFRGHEASFPGRVDWSHSPGGNQDWAWELNRHHFFVTLGRAYWYTENEKYALGFAELLAEWMAANPPGVKEPAWRSVFEVGVRLANWCCADSLFLPATSLDDARRSNLRRGIFAMAGFLAKHLEPHAWNNHLLLEAKALAMAGMLYPTLPRAGAWRKVGWKLFQRELLRQVGPDGVHSERSTLYQRIIASELLELLVVLRLAGHGERDRKYLDGLAVLKKAASFLAALTRADGSVPLLNDSFLHEEHVRFDPVSGAGALLEDAALQQAAPEDEGVIWLLRSAGKRASAASTAASTKASIAFPAGGFWVLRSGAGGTEQHLVFDCGPFGDPVVPGHGHADALSIDWAVGSKHLLVDPGMYSAHLGLNWRNYFRGTSAHNTVVVDGKDQSILSGLRKVYRPAKARLLAWSSCAELDVVAGEHDGYRRLEKAITHRREIFFRKDRFWLIVDRLEGEGSHQYDLLFHLPPSQKPAVDPFLLSAVSVDEDGIGLSMLPLEIQGLRATLHEGEGEEGDGPPQGWVAFESCVKEPAPVLRYRREGPAPARFATILFPLRAKGSPGPALEALEALAESGREEKEVVAGRLAFEDGAEDVFLARPLAGEKGASRRAFLRAGDLETDALFASVSVAAGGQVHSAAMFQGSELRWKGKAVKLGGTSQRIAKSLVPRA